MRYFLDRPLARDDVGPPRMAGVPLLGQSGRCNDVCTCNATECEARDTAELRAELRMWQQAAADAFWRVEDSL